MGTEDVKGDIKHLICEPETMRSETIGVVTSRDGGHFLFCEESTERLWLRDAGAVGGRQMAVMWGNLGEGETVIICGEFCGVPFAITIVTRVVALFEPVETS